MTQVELQNSIISIKIETLDLYSIYFNKRKIGDNSSIKNQREFLVALDLYIQILEYYDNSWVDKDNLEITEEEIQGVIEAAVTLLRTFKNSYYV
jgi:hypothetical protein